METRSTSTDQALSTSSDHRIARHIFSLLLSLRRPARPPELASLCALFPVSPELIVHLCLIPNSPIALNADLHVVPSLVSARAFVEFLARSSFGGQARMWNEVWMRKRGRGDSECGFELPRKRRLLLEFENVEEKDRALLELHFTSPMVQYVTEYTDQNVDSKQLDISEMVNYLPFDANSSGGRLRSRPTEIRLIEGNASPSMQSKVTKELMTCEANAEPALQASMLENLEVPERPLEVGRSIGNGSNCVSRFFLGDILERNMSIIESGNVDGNIADTSVRFVEEKIVEGQEMDNSVASCSFMQETEILSQPHNSVLKVRCGNEEMDKLNCEYVIPTFDKEHTNRPVGTSDQPQNAKAFAAQKHSPKLHAKQKTLDATSSPRFKQLCKSLEHDKAVATRKEKHRPKGDRNVMELRQKKNARGLCSKERKRSSSSVPQKDQMEERIFPNFESYDIEEEEGSGGYGTVYRARRKIEGTTVAIKCPHTKAHKQHVRNEQRMLERFGGKNFIIKYEGCVKHGDSDCFVLEHVEHERPEVLKKEIDVYQLQWYGYCLFRALSSLHKQGVIHRDVKPGNFLFSLKASKGYLIDFNLALDLHQKCGDRNDGKSKAGCDIGINHVKLPNETFSHTKDKKMPNAKSLETSNLVAVEGSKSKLDMKNLKRKALSQTKTSNNDLGSWNVSISQGADGSGITSAERKKEPMPCQGRKELISLVQEVRQTKNNDPASVLSPLRKRVVAPQSVDRTLVYITPMPLLSTGNLVGASHLMNRGNGKSKKEGPCVGTKGFRAPEVLFRSLHQGPKIDVWSAGVTLLYLMVGKAPFFGDPEQNIKDIAKLRGSEDLWEVAKLHNRESSFPEDLYKPKALPCIKLLEWCETSTKRPDFLKVLPRSLFDLVDKCLTVNPRQRITAEEALRHEFFAPCHEALRKQRLLQRQVLIKDPENNSSFSGKSTLKPFKISQVKG